jgi:hypothetical protein
LEKTISTVDSSLNKEPRYNVETVVLILELASTYYDSHTSNDNNSHLIDAQMRLRLKETVSGSSQLIEEYLSLLGFIRYHRGHKLHIPTDKGMQFLKIYRMLASLLI